MQVCPEARRVAKTVSQTSLPLEVGACPLAVRGIRPKPQLRVMWGHVILPPAPTQRTLWSRFQDGHLFPEAGLLLALGSQVKRDKDVTFSKVPLRGRGKTPRVLLVAYFLHVVRVGQASDEFGKYPTSDRPGLKLWVISQMPCDPGQVALLLRTPIFSI